MSDDTSNAAAIRHLETLSEWLSLESHNHRIDALGWLIADRAKLYAERDQLRARVVSLELEHGETRKLNASLCRENDKHLDRAKAMRKLLERCRAGFDWNQYDNAEQNQIGRDLEAFLEVEP
jgi:hypothetical protein